MRCRVLLLLVLTALARAAGSAPASPLILISLDGFRWDYCDRFPEETPTLRALNRRLSALV